MQSCRGLADVRVQNKCMCGWSCSNIGNRLICQYHLILGTDGQECILDQIPAEPLLIVAPSGSFVYLSLQGPLQKEPFGSGPRRCLSLVKICRIETSCFAKNSVSL